MFKAGILSLVIFLSFTVSAQTENAAITPRQTLTGNWGGVRDSLKSNGITLRPRVTMFYQGTDIDAPTFSGKADLKITINGAKIGLPKWTLITQLDQNFGKSINNSGGTLVPQNMANFLPGMKGADTFDITSWYMVVSPKPSTTIMFGKLNMIEIPSSTRFLGGAGVDAFTNPVFAAAPTGIIPPYIFGSIVSLKTKPINYTIMVFDPESYVNKNNFKNLFNDVNISFNAELPVTIGGKPGSHALKVAYSTKDGQDLYHLKDISLPIQDSIAPFKKNRYFIAYTANQYLVKYGEGESGWGLFFSAAISDGNPNAIYTTLYFGLGGNSFIRSRKQDRWGLGYFSYGLSKGLKEYASTQNVFLGNESCYTFYYSVNFTPWISLGADFQLGQSAVKTYDKVFTWGLRTRILL